MAGDVGASVNRNDLVGNLVLGKKRCQAKPVYYAYVRFEHDLPVPRLEDQKQASDTIKCDRQLRDEAGRSETSAADSPLPMGMRVLEPHCLKQVK